MVTATQKAYEELQKNLGNVPSVPTQTPGVQAAPVEQQKPKFYAPTPNAPGPAIQLNPQQNNVWNDPANLIGLWTEMRAKDTTVSDPVLKDIKTIIDYYRAKNPGKQWYEFEGLSPDDPMAGIFSSMAIPMPGQPATIPVIQPEESIATGNLWAPGQATSTAVDMTLWEDGANLPDWQKWAMGLFSQPGWVQGAAQATPWAVLGAMGGAAAGAVGGPGGMALGAAAGGMIAPFLAGGILGYYGDPQTYQNLRDKGLPAWYVDNMEKIYKDGLAGALMWFGEAAEQYVGTTAQAAQAVYESAPALPDVLKAILTGDDLAKADAALKLGPMAEIINDFPAVVEAARLTYESLETALPFTGNIPAAIEMGFEKIGESFVGGRYNVDDVSPVFAKAGQVHILGQPEPIDLDASGMAILKLLREDIKANPNTPAIEIVQAYQDELGFSGQAADMFYQSLLDPLNFVEAGSGIILGRRAGAKGLAGEIAQGPTKTAKITGDLMKAQIDGVPDVSAMSKMDLELARLTPEGQLKDLQKPVQAKEFFNWMTELTPEAKAKASLDMLYENQQIMFELANSEPELHAMINAWGMGDTSTTTKAVAGLLGLPEYKHLREVALQFADNEYKKVKAMYDSGNELGYRDFVYKVAESLKTEPTKVLADIKAGDAKMILDRYKKTLKGEAATAVDSLTVRDITAMQDYFSKSPLTFREYKTQVMEAFTGVAEKWAVKNYGIKPPPLPIRLAHMMKAVQSAFVLGLNPGYAMQNIIDNSVRLRTEGMPLATLPGKIDKFFGPDGFDIKLSRMDEGYGIIGVDPLSKKGAISNAMRSKGAIQGVTDAARKLGEIAPATKLSSVAEKQHTRLAKYGSFKKVWPHMWNSGTVPIPDAIRSGLSTVSAQAGKAFDTVIASAKKASDLELDNVLKKLDDDFTYKRADNYIGDVATELGVDTQMATSLLEQSGALDYLNERIAQGDSMASAKNATRKIFDDFIHDAFKDDVKTRAKQSEARVKVEGWSAVLDLFSDMGQALDERVTRHSAGWTEAWDTFEALRRQDYNAASGIIDSYMRQTRAEWNRLKEWRSSTWEGALKGLGFADEANLTPDANAVMKPLRDTDTIWDTFFVERDKIWGEYAAVAKDLTAVERRAKRTEILTKLSDMYADTSAKELANMREMGDAFNIMWQNQGLPGIDEAKAWWDSMATLTEKRQKFMTDMRNYERGEKVVTPEMKALLKDGGSKKKMWPLFYEKVLLPLYAETIKANDDGIKNVVNAAKKDGGPAKPLPPDAKLLHRLQEQAKIEHDKHVAANPDARLTDMEIDRMVDEGWTNGKKALFNAVNKDKREAGLPTYKKIGDVPMSEALQSMRDRITIDPVAETAAMGPSVPGTVDKVAPVSYVSEVFDQGVGNFIDPLLNGMVEKWQGDITKIDTKNLDPETIRAMKNYLADAQAEFSKRKLAAMKVTDTLTEEMLLNYNKKYNFDIFMDAVFPYQFWYTRSMLNWGARMIDKPQIFSMYYRLLSNLQSDDEDSNMPYRHRGKIRIPAEWLPDEYGDSIFVDPWSKLFSFHQMNNAIDQMAQDNNRLNREAESILYDMVKDELITTEQRKEAIADKESELWLQAYEQAKGANGKDLMDMVSLAMQPAMYIDMPWKLMAGREGEISELPHTRFLQGLTGLTGTDFTKADLIAKGMYGIGVKEFGEWGDYSIKSQLAWMVFEGKIDVEEAEVAMVDKQGPAWDEARMRVMETITLKQPGLMSAMAFREKGLDVALATSLISWLPATLLPQGEIIMRGLKDDYDKAWDDYNSGNLDAIDTFYEDHPEWKIRTPLYMDDQQEMLRRLMYNNITDAYYGLPVELRDQVNEELGDDFTTKLIDKETRDIDAVDMETLATWSRRLGGYAPKDAQGELIRFEDEAGAQLYQDYMDAMKEAFPEKKFMDDYLYSLPEAQQKAARANMPKYQEIWDWQKQYAVENPEIIPYIMREGDKMFGQPPELILEQYKFEVEEMDKFPELRAYKQQIGWDSLTDAQKSVLYDTDPLLRESSAWRSSYLIGHPELIEFNIGEDSKIAGLPQELQQAYYLFYSERDRLYPNISQTWEDLYALPKSQRSSFYNAHPELKEYSQFKEDFYGVYPELENILKPPEGDTLEDYSKEYGPQIDLKELPPYVVTSMYDYYTSDQDMTLGASAYLRYYWEQNGKPLGAFSLWVDSLSWMFNGN